jgi:hypothetical protein
MTTNFDIGMFSNDTSSGSDAGSGSSGSDSSSSDVGSGSGSGGDGVFPGRERSETYVSASFPALGSAGNGSSSTDGLTMSSQEVRVHAAHPPPLPP